MVALDEALKLGTPAQFPAGPVPDRRAPTATSAGPASTQTERCGSDTVMTKTLIGPKTDSYVHTPLEV